MSAYKVARAFGGSLVPLLLVGVTPASAVNYSDATFVAADYTLATYSGPGVTTTLGQSNAGYPGTALEGTYSASGANSAGTLFTALNNSFVYDPSSSGAIASISASLDRYLAPEVDDVPIAVGSYSLRILAQQDGNIYQSIFTFGPFNQPGGEWYSLAKTGIIASDFKLFDPTNFGSAGSITGLDFAGSAITFGFAMRSAGAVDANGNPVSLPSSGIARADNFILSVASVPEPATWAMAIFGFGLVGAGMRNRSARPTPVGI